MISDPPRTVQVRRAEPRDRDAVLRLASAGMREFGIEPDFDGIDRALGSIGAMADGVVAELVAHAGGEICGSIMIAHRDGGTAKLVGFYVDPQRRGQGIGHCLLERAMSAAADAGLAQLRLHTCARMAAACALYESTGWQRDADPDAGEDADRAYSCRLHVPVRLPD